MADVVVAKDLLLGARAADALDHRGVVELVGQQKAVGQQARNGRDCRFVGNETGGEDERSILAVQVGELQLELDQRMVGAGNVAGAAGARAHPPRGVLHGADHRGVLAHAEIVVRAPDGDFLGMAVGAPDRPRKGTGNSFEICEHPIAALGMHLVDGFLEEPLIVHGAFPILGADHNGRSERRPLDQWGQNATPLSTGVRGCGRICDSAIRRRRGMAARRPQGS